MLVRKVKKLSAFDNYKNSAFENYATTFIFVLAPGLQL